MIREAQNQAEPPASASEPPLRVGIAGLGRSGWNIHAKSLAMLPAHYRVDAVMDPEDERCAEAVAVHGCRVHPDFDALTADPDLDVVVVASPITCTPTTRSPRSTRASMWCARSPSR